MLERMLSAVLPKDGKRQASLSIDPSSYSCLGELLDDALIQFKSEIALIEQRRKKDPTNLSYQAFQQEGKRIASALAANGVGPDDRVAVLMSNQPRWLLSAYAVFLRGAVLVPLDYKLGPAEQAALLQHAQAKLLFVDQPLLERFESRPEVHVIVSNDDLIPKADTAKPTPFGAQAWSHWVHDAPEQALQVEPRSRGDVACIVYSSGTGGTPKGCLLTHGNYLAQYEALRELFPMEIGHRFFSILPTNHAIDFMSGFIGPLASGATVVHQRTLRPELIRHTLKTQKISHMAAVPLILEALGTSLEERIEELDTTRRAALELLASVNETLTARAPWMSASRTLLSAVHKEFGGHLQVIFCGGAFVEPHYPELFHRFGIPVVIGYGLTEACTVATLNGLSPFRADSVGRATPGVELRIKDKNTEGIGEVLIRGDVVMKGYLDEPELTAETIDNEGFLHTGDLGYLDASGHLHLVGRKKNMIVTPGGKNIYPEDVEGAFSQLDAEEIAIVTSGALWGGDLGAERLVLVARLRAGRPRDPFIEQASQANLALPDFKRVRSVLFRDEEFPRTASMKLKRNVLLSELRGQSLEETLLTQ